MTDTARQAAPERLVARFPAPTSDRATSIAVVGDPHVTAGEAYVSSGETVAEKPATAEEYLRRAVADINGRRVDGVASIGDLTADSARESFAVVDRLLEGLEPSFVSIPGNHDVREATDDDREVLPQAAFERRYAGGAVPFVHRVGGVELVGLDSMRLRDALADGGPAPQLDWLAETLPGLAAPVVMLHHPLPGMTDWLARFGAHIEDLEPLRLWNDPGPLVDALESEGVPLVLSGHLHVPGVASTRGVREVMAPCLSAFPQSYLRLAVGPDGTDVFLVPVADHEETEADFLRRFSAGTRNQVYASAGAAFLAGPPVDVRNAQ